MKDAPQHLRPCGISSPHGEYRTNEANRIISALIVHLRLGFKDKISGDATSCSRYVYLITITALNRSVVNTACPPALFYSYLSGQALMPEQPSRFKDGSDSTGVDPLFISLKRDK